MKMPELLTMDEIEERHRGEWVVLTDVESDPGPVIKRARVHWHGTDRDEALERASELPLPLNAGILFMGEVWSEGDPIPVL
jgi:hypothetical protein